MKIVGRIQKIAEDQYRFNGKTFDSFLSARREMSIMVRQRRQVRHMRGLSVFGVAGARDFSMTRRTPLSRP
jgi:hypothetical protein